MTFEEWWVQHADDERIGEIRSDIYRGINLDWNMMLLAMEAYEAGCHELDRNKVIIESQE